VRLTFDDGPGPDTPAILDLLGRHGLRAVFFVVGRHVAAHPDIARRAVAEGHALGNHSWSHPDLSRLPIAAARVELERTNDEVEAATGARPELFRPPYGRTTDLLDAEAASLGMRTMLWDVDTRDWDEPGAMHVAKVIRTAPARGVVLLHDGPGPRPETVAGLGLAFGAPG